MSQAYYKVSCKSTTPAGMALQELEQKACKQSVAEYRSDILEYMIVLETQEVIDPVMIEHQPELEWFMRPFLVDFLIELHGYFRLQPETLFLACSIADRYLSTRIVYKRHYQLVVTTSLWIASKYEDKKSRIPTAKELVSLCRNVYDIQMFIQMEKHILSTLEWTVGSVLSCRECLELYLEADSLQSGESKASLKDVASFLTELSLYEKNYMYFSSPVKAVASILVASRVLNDPHWSTVFVQCLIQGQNYPMTDFSLEELDDIQLFFEQPGSNFTQQHIHEIPLLQLDEVTLEEIRKCSLLYLNDIYKSKTLGTKLPYALMNKYKGNMLEQMFDLFTTDNMEIYITLCRLTQVAGTSDDHLLNEDITRLTDILIGINATNNTPSSISYKESPSSTFQSIYPSDWPTYSGGGGGTFTGDKACVDPTATAVNTNALLSRASSQASELTNYSPKTPGSIFSSTLSVVSASTNSSPMISYHKHGPVRMNSISSIQQNIQQPRIVTRFNSVGSDFME